MVVFCTASERHSLNRFTDLLPLSEIENIGKIVVLDTFVKDLSVELENYR